MRSRAYAMQACRSRTLFRCHACRSLFICHMFRCHACTRILCICHARGSLCICHARGPYGPYMNIYITLSGGL
eukprot:jgi/Botrbrau1/720/Bobra.160_2s0043.1